MDCPAELGLVAPISALGAKVYRVHDRVASAIFVAPEIAKPATFTVMDHTTKHGNSQVSYLGGFRVKVLEGVMPKGRLRAYSDACVMVSEDLAFFENPVDPALVPWKKGSCLFDAVALRENELQLGVQLGFMLPNASKMEVLLDLDPGPRVKLEIEALGGEYEGRSPMYPLPTFKETVA